MSAYAAEHEAADGTDSSLLSASTTTACIACDCQSWDHFDNDKPWNPNYHDKCGDYRIKLSHAVTYGTLSPHTCIRQSPHPTEVKHERRSWDLGCGCGGRPALYQADVHHHYMWKRVESDCLEVEFVCGPKPHSNKLLSEDGKMKPRGQVRLEGKDEKKANHEKAWSVRITTCEKTLPPISYDYFAKYFQVRCLKDSVCCDKCDQN